MKKSMGNDIATFIRDAMRACLLHFPISGGAGVPFASSSVAWMTFFWFRQMIPHTLRNMKVPRKPPVRIETYHQVRVMSTGPWDESIAHRVRKKSQPATTVTSAIQRNQNSARFTSLGTRMFFVGASSSLNVGTWTKLK